MSAPPVIGSAHQPQRTEQRTALTYSSLRPVPDDDAVLMQRALLADARRRAHSVAHARLPGLKRALAHRLCFDLVRALRARITPHAQRKREDAADDR